MLHQFVTLQESFDETNERLTHLQMEYERLLRNDAILKSRSQQLQQSINKYHHVGAYTRNSKDEVIGTLTGFLGLHPQDSWPEVPIEIFTLSGRNVQTYSWRATFRQQRLEQNIFDFTESVNIGTFSYPLLTFPAFIGRGYDPDPPAPAIHDCALFQTLAYHRTSTFQPHYDRQNVQLRKTLDRWVIRTAPAIRLLEDVLSWAQ